MVGRGSLPSRSIGSPCLRLPLTTLPTVDGFALRPLVPVALAFLSSLLSFKPTVPVEDENLLLAGRIWLNNLTLLLCGAEGSSACVPRFAVGAVDTGGAAWPETVRFRWSLPVFNVSSLLTAAASASSESPLLLFFDLTEVEFIFGGASILKSIPIPCSVRAFLTGACGGSVVIGPPTTAPTPVSLPARTCLSMLSLNPGGVSSASKSIPPPPATGDTAIVLPLSFSKSAELPKLRLASPLARFLEMLNGSWFDGSWMLLLLLTCVCRGPFEG